MSSETTRLVATTVLRFCFVTTMFATFLVMQLKVLVVIEKKNQIDGSNAKPGDITVQQYHRGFASSAFDVTITHPLQQKYKEIAMEEAGMVAEEAHDRKLLKSLEVCQKEGIHFVPLAWESTGGATKTVHETVRKWTEQQGARGGYPCVHDSPQSVFTDLVLPPEALGAGSDRSSLGASVRSGVVRCWW